MQSDDLTGLPAFLVEAKRRTYAGLDDDATIAQPALPGAKQLEYSAGSFLYRDIYFGMRLFAGLEAVSVGERVIWAMSYSGGVSSSITDRDKLLRLYAFLRAALLQIPEDNPYRGPSFITDGPLRYENTASGDLLNFHGEERIIDLGENVYTLNYSGGRIR